MKFLLRKGRNAKQSSGDSTGEKVVVCNDGTVWRSIEYFGQELHGGTGVVYGFRRGDNIVPNNLGN